MTLVFYVLIDLKNSEKSKGKKTLSVLRKVNKHCHFCINLFENQVRYTELVIITMSMLVV